MKKKIECLTTKVKKIAIDSGADLVGIVSSSIYDKVPRVWIGWTKQKYTKKTIDVMPKSKSIIVIGYHIWDDILEIAIRKNQEWIYPNYLPLTISRLALINYLENKSYKAVPFYSSSYKILAQLAGFGNYGKNTLIINPIFGPWLRIDTILTNAELKSDISFNKDLCGECMECIKVCPTGALMPYKVDDTKCLVGIHLSGKAESQYIKKIIKYEPAITKNSHFMCMECQKVCKYGRKE